MATYEAKRYDFSGANITALNGSSVASGTVAAARIASLATSQITSGTFADARISSGSVTQHVSAVTQATGTWTPSPSTGGFSSTTGRYFRVGNHVTAVCHGHFNSQSTNNTSAFAISGLPVTAANVGTVVGGGTAYLGTASGKAMYPMVKANESSIKFWTNGAVAGTDTDSYSNEYMWNAAGYSGIVITNQNVRNHSNGEANDYFYACVTYQV